MSFRRLTSYLHGISILTATFLSLIGTAFFIDKLPIIFYIFFIIISIGLVGLVTFYKIS